MNTKKIDRYISGIIVGVPKDDDSHYSTCDTCQNGLGNDVYDVVCFIKKEEEIIELEICGECLNYIHNGLED
jgi:hypothetical protein